MTVIWQGPQPTPIDWVTFLDIEEDVRRELEIVDGFVVPREQRGRDHQKVGTRLSLALERAAVAEMRGSGGGSCYETNTEVDVKIGTLTIERYTLSDRTGPYIHIGTGHRDMGPVAVAASDPFPLELLWADLEIAPRV
ncbi:hypothetical protein OG225_28480 [Nocardia sp. NBC_01377]|uniref:hypothetical protein n=1 Tax=Nocardia sp. NBC_01377 TaxID=2903595 RepID=UPI00324A729C